MVSQLAKEKNAQRAAFRTFQERLNLGGALWLKRLRETALDRFEQLGFPTVDEEEWKYTNVAPLEKIGFEPFDARPVTAPIDAVQLESFTYTEARHSRLVFVNGVYQPELSSLEALPQGVLAVSMIDALQDDQYAEVVREQVSLSDASDTENAFTALNTAFLSSGAVLLIPKGVQVEAPIHLLFLNAPQPVPAVSFPRLLIVAGQNSEATVIESYAGLGDGLYWTNAVVDVLLKEGARLELYKVQNESAQAFHIARTRAELNRSSSFNMTTITLGAQLARHDIHVAFEGEGAECWVDGLYIVGTGQHADTHSVIDHRRPHCTSHQLYKGILDGKSRAVFNGKVFVREGAQQTDAMQTNRNLLLSNEARVDTKPQLEIFADDVKCAHGATVGQLEEEQLFYLASRGMHTDIARNLLTYGFAEEVIDKIKIGSIKAQLDEAVLNRLHARLEV
ncbi:MAG TPA: Fe-S cluster assembly protein SufD [Pyrinomonadaceae bacterium]|jgi:Fe-S cluster assembly protein SufD